MIVVNRRGNAGFSLIELLTVVILLGIIGVVALGRLGNQSAFEARGFFDDTVTAVRYAQKLAVSNGCNVRVKITAGSYAVFWPSDGCTGTAYITPVPVPNPANRGQSYQNLNVPSGYSLTPGNITFNSFGIRTEAAPGTFSLSYGTDIYYTFDVHENTGLVQVTVTP